MNSDWARRSGMDKFLEMTSRKGRAGFGLGMSWQLIGERGSATHRSRQSLVAARERKGLSREPHVSTTAGVAAQRTAVMCSLVSTENGGGWEPRGPFRLVGFGLTRNMCLHVVLRMQHDIFRSKNKKKK